MLPEGRSKPLLHLSSSWPCRAGPVSEVRGKPAARAAWAEPRREVTAACCAGGAGTRSHLSGLGGRVNPALPLSQLASPARGPSPGWCSACGQEIPGHPLVDLRRSSGYSFPCCSGWPKTWPALGAVEDLPLHSRSQCSAAPQSVCAHC